jgi:hypothetical protein
MASSPSLKFDTFFAQAKTLHKAGRLAEAITLYARAAELKPDYAEALGNALGTPPWR